MSLQYFSDEELACPLTNDYTLAEGFGERLDELRIKYGKPIKLNSAARSTQYNIAKGGHPRSLHVYDAPYHNTGGCCAVDIRCHNGVDRWLLIHTALNMGFSVGVDHTFIHIDDRTRVAGLINKVYSY